MTRMATNIEFKAKIRDYHAASATAMALSGTRPKIITQEDVFFRCQNGRLKLRIFGDGQGELIHYQRDDVSGPKRSNYCVLPTATPHALHRVLADALGETVIVRKTRALYLIGSTRIHLDSYPPRQGRAIGRVHRNRSRSRRRSGRRAR